MEWMKPRSPGFKAADLSRRAARGGAAGLLALFLTGFSSHSDPPGRSASFELEAREVRDESFFVEELDTLVTRRFESTLAYFGRVETASAAGGARVQSDSLVFHSLSPFRFDAILRPDTFMVVQSEKAPAARSVLEEDRRMLTCIFTGPALSIEISPRTVQVEDLKAHCEGGLYRRLDLAVTLGAFIFAVPEGIGEPAGRWTDLVEYPSFSGLAHATRVQLVYTAVPVENGGRPTAVEVTCDTTLSNVSATASGGFPADIVSNRIRIRGVLRTHPDIGWFHAGEFEVEEEIRYVRPDLATPVLHKRCRAEIALRTTQPSK